MSKKKNVELQNTKASNIGNNHKKNVQTADYYAVNLALVYSLVLVLS